MTGRPLLKIKAPSLVGQPPADIPLSTTSTKTPKLKIRFGSSSQPHNPSDSAPNEAAPAAGIVKAPKAPKAPRKPKTDKPARAPKPTSKKRALEDSAVSDNDDEKPNIGHGVERSDSISSVKRIKLTTKNVNIPTNGVIKEEKVVAPRWIRTKFKGRIPDRPVGVGYDSGASDAEEDPALEEEFVLRMVPGEDCDYLRQAVAERRWGTKDEGGADVRMQFLRSDGRRTVISIQKRLYAAALVDLPCVIEGMKSWDKKNWMKTADICQLLLVLGRVETEKEAEEYPLPKEVDEQTWQYAHGLTPPMRWARKRRFRKRLSNRTIEAVEEEVERLLAADEEAETSTVQEIHLDRLTQDELDTLEPGEDQEDYGGDEMDAEGDNEEDAEGDEDIEDHYGTVEPEDDTLDLEAELAAEYEKDKLAMQSETTLSPQTQTQTQDPETQTPPSSAAATPLQPLLSDAETPSATAPTPTGKDIDSGDDESMESDEDADLDENAREKQHERERQQAEIEDLKAMIKAQEEKAAVQVNAILKRKVLESVVGLKRDLGVKMAAIGEGEEDEV